MVDEADDTDSEYTSHLSGNKQDYAKVFSFGS
jgi:hypothetical protein